MSWARESCLDHITKYFIYHNPLGNIYGSTEGTCENIYLSRSHDLISRSHDIIARSHDIIISFPLHNRENHLCEHKLQLSDYDI